MENDRLRAGKSRRYAQRRGACRLGQYVDLLLRIDIAVETPGKKFAEQAVVRNRQGRPGPAALKPVQLAL